MCVCMCVWGGGSGKGNTQENPRKVQIKKKTLILPERNIVNMFNDKKCSISMQAVFFHK